MGIDTILFDWDGTLIDTADAAFDAFRKALLDLSVPLEYETYVRIYSPNWYSMYEALGLARERWTDADNLWLSHYSSDTCVLVSGAKAALEELRRGNYTLGIVTSGSRARVLSEIGRLDLADAFRVIVCSDDVVNRKPHPEGLEKAMRQLGKRPESCCYVGDCPDDIEMGKRAGVLTVGILSSYPVSGRLAASNPDLSFASLEEFQDSVLAQMNTEGR